ncbi:hypothetical protein EWM64_g368 [Hericium alpestre]|uniref:Cleavage/polyadenylation specificity factor A subunit N-terminal domain-containing protein n=1 Tax=Hericium alpestre TaxID=135208 RepID=A0A4Z0AC57_9AGAM|nr:hypothetical protein EWM64_g368 [Hericium alpestre]
MVLWDALSVDGKVQGRIISPPSYWVLWGRESWTSAVACPDGNENSVYVAITGTQNREAPGSTTVLMRVPLDPDAPCSEGYPQSTTDSYKSDQGYFATHDLQFNDVDTFLGADSQNVRAIEPSKQLIAYTRGMYIDILHWPTNTGVTIDTQIDDLEQLWNGIIGLQFVGSYILCVKARTVELYPAPYPFPAQSSYFVPSTLGPTCRPDSPMARAGARRSRLLFPATNIAKHAFPGTNFRGVFIAAPSSSMSDASEEPTPMVLSFLAHDVLRGVYHYHVHITPATTSSSAPTMRVELVGLQDMSKGAPGFISAAALGPQGRRGAWIERTRNATSRRVSVFSANPLRPVSCADVLLPQPVTIKTRPRASSMSESPGSTSSDASDSDDDPENDLAHGPMGGAPMNAHVVYEVKSYDLREDLTFIAFSEVSGRIVLGTRFGAIRVI